MRKIMGGLMVVMVLSGLLSIPVTMGCKTVTTSQVDSSGQTNLVQTTTIDPVQTAAAIRAVVPAGVAIVVQKDPNAAAYFQAAAVAVRLVASSGNYSPAEVDQVLSTISIRELRTPEAAAVTQAALAIYKAYFGDLVAKKIATADWVLPVLWAIADGLEAGLPAPPPLPPK